MLIEVGDDMHELENNNKPKGKGGFLQYQTKMKYFPKIATDLEGRQYDCNVQTPLSQLKVKGNKSNMKNPQASKFQAEVPHGGIWVKRASTKLDNFSPKMGTDNLQK